MSEEVPLWERMERRALAQPRRVIEQQTAQVKADIEGHVADAQDTASVYRQSFEEKTDFWPKYHPVWSEEIRHEIWKERVAGIETGPKTEHESNYTKWPDRFDPEKGRQELIDMRGRLQDMAHETQARWGPIEAKLDAWQERMMSLTQAVQQREGVEHGHVHRQEQTQERERDEWQTR